MSRICSYHHLYLSESSFCMTVFCSLYIGKVRFVFEIYVIGVCGGVYEVYF